MVTAEGVEGLAHQRRRQGQGGVVDRVPFSAQLSDHMTDVQDLRSLVPGQRLLCRRTGTGRSHGRPRLCSPRVPAGAGIPPRRRCRRMQPPTKMPTTGGDHPGGMGLQALAPTSSASAARTWPWHTSGSAEREPAVLHGILHGFVHGRSRYVRDRKGRRPHTENGARLRRVACCSGAVGYRPQARIRVLARAGVRQSRPSAPQILG